jgi:uncharacterized protein (TIGR02246 family)
MSDEIRRAIAAGNQKFMDAISRGDGAAVAALYTATARALPPGAPVVEGRAAIQAFWQGVIDSGVRDVKLETIAVETTGASLAAEVGRAVLTVNQPGGESATVEGKYVVVWKEDGGEWKLHADIWNMNA